jgi:hypothetical protein
MGNKSLVCSILKINQQATLYIYNYFPIPRLGVTLAEPLVWDLITTGESNLTCGSLAAPNLGKHHIATFVVVTHVRSVLPRNAKLCNSSSKAKFGVSNLV